jgi:serine/threonine protein kinase
MISNFQVKLSRSIRHPHLLTFYGAGVDSDDRAFLVSELMSGSLKTMLRDLSIPLSWRVRLTFACDISRGMSYLHEHGMLHRDLKADNCFVDNKTMRVKVADFGTGHVGARMASKNGTVRGSRGGSVSTMSLTSSRSSNRRGSVDSRTRHESITMSTGGGSLLWMAPERLSEQRVTETEAKAGDVYRYRCIVSAHFVAHTTRSASCNTSSYH